MKCKIAILVFLITAVFTSQIFAQETKIVIEVDDPDDKVEVTVEKKSEKPEKVVRDYDRVRVGITLGSEMSEILFDDHEAFGVEFRDHILPGVYAEVLLGRVGIGATGFARFSKTDSLFTEVAYEWTISWIGSADIRYHFFKQATFIDPFVEAGIGCAGSVQLPEYNLDGEIFDDGKLEALSLFVQIGGGASVRLDRFHVGAKVLWRVYNDVPPATPFTPVEIADFHVAVFAGIGF